MIGHLYNIVSSFFMMIVVIVIAHYIFLEPKLKKKPVLFYIISLLLITVSEFMFSNDLKYFVSIACSGVYICIARNRHHIRGFFLVFPIFGIIYGLSFWIVLLPQILFAIPESELHFYDFIFDCIIYLVLFILFIWKKTWRKEFQKELQYRSLERWERRLLNTVGIFFWIVGISVSLDNVPDLDIKTRIYIGLLLVISLFLTITIIILILQGNKRAYYSGIADLNEQYLISEMNHFKAYQNTQKETRRVRHDMKNHMMCLQHLAQLEDLEGIQKYLNNLGSIVEQIDTELHCGNPLIDAICNEKNQLASQYGIRFEIDGQLPETLHIEPVDLCTIFTNALDNCIEFLQTMPEHHRFVKLTFHSQGEFLFLNFTNPISDKQSNMTFGKTTKSDSQNHGFGLHNIQLSVEKYNGKMNTSIEKIGNQASFVLEIMLMNQ